MGLWGRSTGLFGDYECAFCRLFSVVVNDAYSIRDANLAHKLLDNAAKAGFEFSE